MHCILLDQLAAGERPPAFSQIATLPPGASVPEVALGRLLLADAARLVRWDGEDQRRVAWFLATADGGWHPAGTSQVAGALADLVATIADGVAALPALAPFQVAPTFYRSAETTARPADAYVIPLRRSALLLSRAGTYAAALRIHLRGEPPMKLPPDVQRYPLTAAWLRALELPTSGLPTSDLVEAHRRAHLGEGCGRHDLLELADETFGPRRKVRGVRQYRAR